MHWRGPGQEPRAGKVEFGALDPFENHHILIETDSIVEIAHGQTAMVDANSHLVRLGLRRPHYRTHRFSSRCKHTFRQGSSRRRGSPQSPSAGAAVTSARTPERSNGSFTCAPIRAPSQVHPGLGVRVMMLRART